MARMTRPRLKSVQALANFKLHLTFIDGSIREVDFKPLFKESIGLAPLLVPQDFAKACLGESEGWAVEWPELDIQVGADTLWLDAQAQSAVDEPTRVFAKWRARYGLSLSKAAEALGLSSRTVSAYGTGERPVPRYIALAVKGWELEHTSQH